MLKRTQDRKTATSIKGNGKQSRIANAFSLPAGNAYSCPGATEFCQKICYAGKLERMYPPFKNVVLRNWELLKDADIATMYHLLLEMIDAFSAECDKHNAPKKFRIHADGDFFNMTYVRAWSMVIEVHSDIQFWVYTRSDFAAEYLNGRHSNLSLFFSADPVNVETAKVMESNGIRIAMVDNTFDDARDSFKGVRCPEQNAKGFDLINEDGGACVRCGLCVFQGKGANVLFSVTKK